MNENDTLSTQLEQMIGKAVRSLTAAKYSIDAGDYDFQNNFLKKAMQ